MPLPTPNRPGADPSGGASRNTPPQKPHEPYIDEDDVFSSVVGPAAFFQDDEEEELLRDTRASLEESASLAATPGGATAVTQEDSFTATSDEVLDQLEEAGEITVPEVAPRTVKKRPPLQPLVDEDEDDEDYYEDDEEEDEFGEDEAEAADEQPSGSARKHRLNLKKESPKDKKPKREKPKRKFLLGKDPSAGLPAGETEDTFVDKNKGTLLPFGTGRNAKVSEFDHRNNLEMKRKITAGVSIGLLALFCGLGAKNAFFPPEQWSESEISAIAAKDRGDTGFPLDRGQGFAIDFMRAYLNVNNSPVADRLLGYYYTGSLKGEADKAETRITSSDFRQEIMMGPTVYRSESKTPSTAAYTVGAVVQASSKNSLPPADGSAAQLNFFNVNVYYDKATDSFLVTPDSPTVVPAAAVGDLGKLPAAGPLGTGESSDELNQAVQSVVYGFVKGYAITTPTDHSAIDQYITKTDDPELLKGMAGRYTIQGEDSEAINYEAYTTVDPLVVKVAVKVKWTDSTGSSTNIAYMSNYVMTLEKQDNGKYLVSKFAPQYYAPASEVAVPTPAEGS